MAYEKRICILKQVKKGFSADGNQLTGVVYAELIGETLTVTLRMPGLSALKEGRYVLVLQIGGKVFFAADGEMKLENAPSVKNGFAALLCFVRSEAEPIAFGTCGFERADMESMRRALTENSRKRPIPTPMSPIRTPSPLAPNVPYAPGVPLPADPDDGREEEKDGPFRKAAVPYDDEAIADSNYYAPSHADESGDRPLQTEGKEAAGESDPLTDEDTFVLTRGSLTYYKEVREELEAVLKKYPADTRLKWAFPTSEWARNGKSLIGIVYEEGIPRYLCVATEQPDPDLEGQSVFVPATPFSDEHGFYVVFQDADTGAYVRVGSA